MKQLPSSLSPSTHRQRGFTLVETVVTIALFATLAYLAFPTYSELVRQWRRDSATGNLSTSLQLARSEAIKSSRQIVVCPSSDEVTCAASTEWRNGWIVFVDDGAGSQVNAKNQAHDSGERVLKVVPTLSSLSSLTSSGGVQWMQFLPNGLMRTGAAANITFTVTPSGATASTKVDRITVSPVGRVSITTELP